MVLLMKYTVCVTGEFVQIAAIIKDQNSSWSRSVRNIILSSAQCSLFLLPPCLSTLLDWFGEREVCVLDARAAERVCLLTMPDE